jgi:hypothetical protein
MVLSSTLTGSLGELKTHYSVKNTTFFCTGDSYDQVLKYCSYFHDETLKHITAKVIIHDSVKESELKRSEGATIDDLRRKNGLIKVEEFVYALENALGDTDPNFQAIANIFADEVIACAISALNDHNAVSTAIVLAEWAAELPSYGQSRKWLMEQRQNIFTWDSSYVSEEDSNDDLEDIEVNVEADENKEEEINQLSSAKNIVKGTTACPTCSERFEPDEVIEYTHFGVRCPYCNQSIVV